ncbi:MAG: hypothetical protein KZQ83_09285 [gamma proteobacterium symbiont of Taylorina sp.]|nr:hypothetical protein [gamma proteobacterium symbiont of Taylorina sp.]
MNQCYEYFECIDTTCVKYNNLDEPCWMLENTACEIHNDDFKMIYEIEDKKELCKTCLYFRDYETSECNPFRVTLMATHLPSNEK